MQQINALPTQATPQQTNAIELKDIHLPEQISDFPVAYGWWLLVALLILIIVISIIKMRKTAKRNQVKKQALTQLSFSLKNNAQMTTSETIALLKWAAMHYFSRAELAKLFGDSLQQFLTSKLPLKHQKNFTNLSEQAFLNQYHAQPKASKEANNHVQTDENIHKAATLWLTHALPPKASPKPSEITKKSASTSKNNSLGVNA